MPAALFPSYRVCQLWGLPGSAPALSSCYLLKGACMPGTLPPRGELPLRPSVPCSSRVFQLWSPLHPGVSSNRHSVVNCFPVSPHLWKQWPLTHNCISLWGLNYFLAFVYILSVFYSAVTFSSPLSGSEDQSQSWPVNTLISSSLWLSAEAWL